MQSILILTSLLLCLVSGQHVSRVRRQGFQLGQQAPDPTCTSPTGATGKCISVIRCPDIFKILTSRPIPPGQLNFLRESVCGRDEFNRPKFCCAPRQTAVVNLGFPPSTSTTNTTPKPQQNDSAGTTESLSSTTVTSTTTTRPMTTTTNPETSSPSSTTEPTPTTTSVLPSDSSTLSSDSTTSSPISSTLAPDSTTLVTDSTTLSSDSTTLSSDTTTLSSDTTTVSSDTTTIASDTTTLASDSSTLASDSTTSVTDSSTLASDSTTLSSSTTSTDSTTLASTSTTPSSDSTTPSNPSTLSTSSSTTTAPIPTQSQTLSPSQDETEVETLEATTKVTIVDKAVSVDEVGAAEVEDFIFPRLSECGNSNASIPRIVGGRDSNKGDWPWIAVLGFADGKGIDFSCGGTLITRKHVLTAAHCVKDLPLRVVRLGEHILSETDEARHQDFTPIKKIIHPEYNSNFRNDIAILELDREVTFEEGHIAPACLPSPETYDGFVEDGARPFVAGWGALGYSKGSADILQDVQVEVINTGVCAKSYSRFRTVTIDERTLCAGWRTGGQDACQGDSGGPLVQNYNPLRKYFLVGVVSLGYKCAEAQYPGIYSRVSYYMPWIMNTIID